MQRWQKAMTLDFMSSEESANGSDSDDKFMEKPILWRSEKLTDFFKNKLEPATFSRKGKHMRQHRIEGSPTEASSCSKV